VPEINGLGRLGAGVAGGTISIDNGAIASGGGACWMDDDNLVFGGPSAGGGWYFRKYTVSTKTFTDIDPNGPNFVAAGGGRYAFQGAALVTNGWPFTPATSRMSLCITDGRGAANPEGLVALCTDGSCTRFNVYAPGIPEPIDSVPGAAYNLCLVRPGAYVWDGGEYGYHVDLPIACTRRRVVTLNGVDWIVGWSNALGVFAAPNGSKDGYIIVPSPGLAYYHQARVVGGRLLIAWSTTQGEALGTNAIVAVDMSKPLQPLVPTPVVPTFSFNHPVIVAPFKDPQGATAAPMEVVVNQNQQTKTRPAFGAEDSILQVLPGQLQGVYSENTASPETPLTIAQDLRTRLVLCHDAQSIWTPPPGLRPYDIPCVELYLLVGESAASAYTRWVHNVDAVLNAWRYSTIAVVPMFYCEGGAPPNETFTVAQVCDALQYLSQIVNSSSRITVILPFEYLRANGITGHPELQQAFDNLEAAAKAAGLATLPPISSTFKQLRRVKMQPFSGFVKINQWGAPELYYTGVNPNDPSKAVYFNRPNEPNQGGPWELINFTPQGNLWAAKYDAASVWLSIQNNGTLQSRPGGNNPGAFELFQIRQEDDSQRIILYRDDLIGCELLVEVKQ
jgi:hypothetical protein